MSANRKSFKILVPTGLIAASLLLTGCSPAPVMPLEQSDMVFAAQDLRNLTADISTIDFAIKNIDDAKIVELAKEIKAHLQQHATELASWNDATLGTSQSSVVGPNLDLAPVTRLSGSERVQGWLTVATESLQSQVRELGALANSKSDKAKAFVQKASAELKADIAALQALMSVQPSAEPARPGSKGSDK